MKKTVSHNINIVEYVPLKGKSYIPLPEELRHHNKGLINLKNEDSECFRWCHNRHLNPQEKHTERIKKEDKKYVKKLDYTGVTFPVQIKDIPKIEKQNEFNVNVFGYEKKQPYLLHIFSEKYRKQLNILLITDGDNKHYVLIKYFNRFMCHQTKHKQ